MERKKEWGEGRRWGKNSVISPEVDKLVRIGNTGNFYQQLTKVTGNKLREGWCVDAEWMKVGIAEERAFYRKLEKPSVKDQWDAWLNI